MKMILKILFKLSDFLNIFAKGVSLICLSLMTATMILEVIWRNLFMSLTWSEEFAVTFLGTWFVFVGAAVPLKAGQMISIQFIKSILPQKVAPSVTIAGELMILFFLILIIKYGYDLVKLTMPQPSPALMYPIGYAYLAIPIGCIIMFYQTVILMLQRRSLSDGSTKT